MICEGSCDGSIEKWYWKFWFS